MYKKKRVKRDKKKKEAGKGKEGKRIKVQGGDKKKNIKSMI